MASSTLNSSVAFGGVLSTSVDLLSDMEQTASSLQECNCFSEYHARRDVDGTGTKNSLSKFRVG